MFKILSLWLGISTILLLPSAAGAFDASLQRSFNALQNAVRKADKASIRAYVTSNSLPTVERLLGYKLEGCLPKKLEYTKERYEEGYVYVTVSTPYAEDRDLTSELAFKRVGGSWKLDVPESFRNGLGNDWASTLNQAEMLYEAMQTQLGGVLRCDAIQNMLQNDVSSSSTLPRPEGLQSL